MKTVRELIKEAVSEGYVKTAADMIAYLSGYYSNCGTSCDAGIVLTHMMEAIQDGTVKRGAYYED